MKLNLGKWLRPASASTEELEQQLSKAEEQYSEAMNATLAAREAFDATGATSAETALLEAEDTERRAATHVDRARRLLTAARERDAEQHRRQLEAEAQALEAELGGLRQQASNGAEVEAELQALLAVADARVERWRFVRRVQETQQRLANVNRQLGRETSGSTEIDTPYAHAVADRLADVVRQLGSDPRARLVSALRPGAGDYAMGATREELETLEPLARGSR